MKKLLAWTLVFSLLFPYSAFAKPLLGQPVVWRGTVTDLRISAVDGAAFIDAMDGTIAEQYGKVLHTGTVTQANMKLSATNGGLTASGGAFIDFGNATTDLTDHLGKFLVVTDHLGNKIKGWTKAAGTGETLSGVELVTNGNMETGSPPTSWTPGSGVTLASVTDDGSQVLGISNTGAYLGATQTISTTTASLIKLVFGKIRVVSGIATYGYITANLPLVTSNSFVSQTNYYTPLNNSVIIRLLNSAATMESRWDNVSAQQTLTPSTSGVTITSTKAGTTYNWESKDAGFTYNDSAGYTYTIYDRDVTALATGDYQLEVFDSAGKFLRGVMKAQGTGETLSGIELVTNGGFDSDTGWNKGANYTIESGVLKATSVAAYGYTSQTNTIPNPNVGILFKSVFTVTVTSGGIRVILNSGNGPINNHMSSGTFSEYATGMDNSSRNLWVRATNEGFSGTLDNASLQQVLTPSTLGVTVVNAKGGIIPNWSYKNSAFAYNQASYYCIVKKMSGPSTAPVAWWKADDLADANGTAIGTWVDKMGSYNATQADAAKKPAVIENCISTRKCLRFDGSNDNLQTASITLNTGMSVFAVTKTITVGKELFIEQGANAGTVAGFYICGNLNSWCRRITSQHYDAGVAIWLPTVSSIAAYVYISGDKGYVYKNGVIQSSATTGVSQGAGTSSGVINIGSRDGGASLPSNADLSEIIIFNRALSDSERIQIEDWLGSYYGITITR